MNIHLHCNNAGIVFEPNAHHIITVLQVLTLEGEIIWLIYRARHLHRLHFLIGVVAIYVHCSRVSTLGCRYIFHIQFSRCSGLYRQRQCICDIVPLRKEYHTVYHKRRLTIVVDHISCLGSLCYRCPAKIKLITTINIRTLYYNVLTAHGRNHILLYGITEHRVLRSYVVTTTVTVKTQTECCHHSIITMHWSIPYRIKKEGELSVTERRHCSM